MGRIDLPDLSALSLSDKRFEPEEYEPEPTGMRGPTQSKDALKEATVDARLKHALDVGFMLEKRSAFENLYQRGRNDDWINRLLPEDVARQATRAVRVLFRVRSMADIAVGIITEEQVRAAYMGYSYEVKKWKYRTLVNMMRSHVNVSYNANMSEERPNIASQRTMRKLLEVLTEKFPDATWPPLPGSAAAAAEAAPPPSSSSRRIRGERV